MLYLQQFWCRLQNAWRLDSFPQALHDGDLVHAGCRKKGVVVVVVMRLDDVGDAGTGGVTLGVDINNQHPRACTEDRRPAVQLAREE